MKSIWRKKWLVVVMAVAIFLSIGAVAWAATSDNTADPAEVSTAPSAGVETLIAGLDEALGDGSGTPAERAAAGVKAAKQRAEKFLHRQAALMNKLREDMSAADQALCDELVETFKEQREALKQARQNLAETSKQLRDLRDKYLDTTASPATN